MSVSVLALGMLAILAAWAAILAIAAIVIVVVASDLENAPGEHQQDQPCNNNR
jgi:hypothetical protein